MRKHWLHEEVKMLLKKRQDLDVLTQGGGLARGRVQKGPSWPFSSESLEMSLGEGRWPRPGLSCFLAIWPLTGPLSLMSHLQSECHVMPVLLSCRFTESFRIRQNTKDCQTQTPC